MDLLTEVLLQAGLRRRLLDMRRLAPGTALRFPCDKSIGLHVLTQGQAFIHTEGTAEPLALAAGDVAVMARGCHHALSTQAVCAPVQQAALAEGWPGEQGPPVSAGAATVVSGAYQFWNDPLHPFFAQMPAWFVLRADSLPRFGPLALTLELLQQEIQQPELGSDTLVHGLLDAIFTYVLREVVARQPVGAAGWGQALRDAQVRQVVAWMHDDIARAWTLEELARRAGLSRTALAERFRSSMGDTPLNYLRTVRMQRAMQLLSETEGKLEQVAAAVGYQDAFGFSKVFKRVVGMSPKDFRRRDEAERALPWRLGAA